MTGKLYIVSTPIGNDGDMSRRAIETLAAVDVIVCEDLKPARRLLHTLKIEKPLLPLNEHTTREASDEALELLTDGKSLALISDAGTPLIADPGAKLVNDAITFGIAITAVPGPTSIITALSLSGFSTLRWTFVGFLPRDKAERRRAAAEYRSRPETLVFLEAPYRLKQLLDDLFHAFSGNREAVICTNLTMPEERVFRGSLLELKEQFETRTFKGEFVVVVNGQGNTRTRDRR